MDKLAKLVDQLLLRSTKKTLDWEDTATNRCFQVSLGERTIRIFQDDIPAEIGVVDYTIEIINGSGQIIESFTDRQLDKLSIGLMYFHKMRDIYELARRKALDVDKTIDDLLDDLRDE